MFSFSLRYCKWGNSFLGRIGGATTFASAKVKDAIGRIGIFIIMKFTFIVWQASLKPSHQLLACFDVEIKSFKCLFHSMSGKGNWGSFTAMNPLHGHQFYCILNA